MAPTTAKTPTGLLTFRRAPVAGLDCVLPARTGPLLAAVVGVAALFWVAGWALADERARFLASREWWVQPLYLAVHLALLRLFVSAYAGNFAAGCAFLAIEPAEVPRRLRRVLGVPAVVGACLLAAPLVALDIEWLRGKEYLGAGDALGAGSVLGAADWLMAAAWAVEWVINVYIWLLILGFLVQTLKVLRRHDFRDPIERVLRERQYRPFLLMSAQGASLTLVFAFASAAYVWIAEGATSDYIGLWVTGGLILVGFVPPWMTLKARLGAVVDAEAVRVGGSLDESTAALGSGERRPADSLADVGARLDFVLDMVRLEHLRRLHENLGKSEAQAIVLRLLVPAVTGGWRFVKPLVGL